MSDSVVSQIDATRAFDGMQGASGTTPEEAGLTYSQTLAQSSLAVLVIFVLVVLSTWLLLTYLRHTVRGAMVGRGTSASRRYLAGLDGPAFEHHLAKLREVWSRNPADLATFEHVAVVAEVFRQAGEGQ